MTFNFSIRATLKESWSLFRMHPWYFAALSAVMVLLNIVGNNKSNHPGVIAVMALSVVASVILSYVWLSVSLAAADAKHELLTFKTLRQHLPSVRNFFMIIGVGLMTALFFLLGFIALIIPGIYIMVRLMFANLAYVDRKGGVMQSLRYSWHLVKGEVFWTAFLTMVVSIGIIILGVIFFGIGMLITYPVAMLLIAKLYRALTQNHEEQAVVVQPEELEAPEEPITEPVVA